MDGVPGGPVHQIFRNSFNTLLELPGAASALRLTDLPSPITATRFLFALRLTCANERNHKIVIPDRGFELEAFYLVGPATPAEWTPVHA